MINNIKNNTISEALAKQKLDALNEIRKAETKNKRLINGQKILLSLFDDLVEAISNNNNNNSNRSKNKNDNESANDNESVNDKESVNDNESVNNYDSDDQEEYYKIKQIIGSKRLTKQNHLNNK